MASILGRQFYGVNGDQLPASQYLHRDKTLFVFDEWVWLPTREGAHEFETYLAAEEAMPRFTWTDKSGRTLTMWAVTVPRPDVPEQQVRETVQVARREESLAACPASSPPIGVAAGRKSARKPRKEFYPTPDRPVSPPAKVRTTDDFRQVFEKMQRDHPPEDVFEETERRYGK